MAAAIADIDRRKTELGELGGRLAPESYGCDTCEARPEASCVNKNGLALKRAHPSRSALAKAEYARRPWLTKAEQKLDEQREAALASYSLVGLWDDAPIRWEPTKQMTGGFDVRALRDELRGFGFTRMADELPSFPKARFYPRDVA